LGSERRATGINCNCLGNTDQTGYLTHGEREEGGWVVTRYRAAVPF
jgi:hypothetical protein